MAGSSGAPRKVPLAVVVVLVVLAVAAGVYAVVLAVGDGEPQAEPTAPTTPSSPSPTSIPPSPSLPIGCEISRLQGDFDGDATSDLLVTHYPRPEAGCLEDPFGEFLPYRFAVQFASGAVLDVEAPGCQSLCRAHGVIDLDGDGDDEFAVMVASGASTSFLSFFRVTAEEARVAEVAPPGAPGFPAGEALFAVGGSVTHLNYLTCEEGRALRLIATAAELSEDGGMYTLHEVVFLFDGASFVPLSTDDREVSFDEFNQGPAPVTGTSCPGLPG